MLIMNYQLDIEWADSQLILDALERYVVYLAGQVEPTLEPTELQRIGEGLWRAGKIRAHLLARDIMY